MITVITSCYIENRVIVPKASGYFFDIAKTDFLTANFYGNQ